MYFGEIKRPITGSCTTKTLNKSEDILALTWKNPELETQKALKLQKRQFDFVTTS